MIRIFCESGSPWISAATALLEDQSYEVGVVYGEQRVEKITWQGQYEEFLSSEMTTVWNMSHSAPSIAGLIGIAADGSVPESEFQSIFDDIVSVSGGTLP